VVQAACRPGGPVAIGLREAARLARWVAGLVTGRTGWVGAVAVCRAWTSAAILTVLWASTPSPHQVVAPASPSNRLRSQP
jgi:hypothetical protein